MDRLPRLLPVRRGLPRGRGDRRMIDMDDRGLRTKFPQHAVSHSRDPGRHRSRPDGTRPGLTQRRGTRRIFATRGTGWLWPAMAALTTSSAPNGRRPGPGAFESESESSEWTGATRGRCPHGALGGALVATPAGHPPLVLHRDHVFAAVHQLAGGLGLS